MLRYSFFPSLKEKTLNIGTWVIFALHKVCEYRSPALAEPPLTCISSYIFGLAYKNSPTTTGLCTACSAEKLAQDCPSTFISIKCIGLKAGAMTIGLCHRAGYPNSHGVPLEPYLHLVDPAHFTPQCVN